MGDKKGYILLTGYTPDGMERRVNELIERGYLIYGPPVVWGKMLAQAMVLSDHTQGNA